MLAALAKRGGTQQNDIDEDVDATGADALDGATRDEHCDVVGAAANAIAEREEGEGEEKGRTAAGDVGDLAEERLRDCGCDDEAVGDPDELGRAADASNNGGQAR